MCGIAAIIRSSNSNARAWSAPALARMERAIALLSRRGPDGHACRAVANNHALLGHTRLAIQDLSAAAAQPMSTPDGSLTISYNGEIYNAPELRSQLTASGRTFHTRSDTEVLLHAIAEWGPRPALDKLRGMFSFVAVQHANGRTNVFAAVDPAGMKPLAWTLAPDPDAPGERLLMLASECDALRELMPTKPRVDATGLRHVLSVGYCPAPHTVWAGVQKLGPGTFLEWNGAAEPTVGAWWSPPAHPSEAHDAEPFDLLLARLANDHLIGDVPVGMFLSAGLDSASIALALAERATPMSSIASYTLSTNAPTDEAADAAEIARMLGMTHRTIRFTPGDLEPTLRAAAARFDEPQGFSALLTATRIADAMRAVAPDAKVVLSGDGGDESLGGYAWHRDAPTHPLALTSFAAPGRDALRDHARLAALVAEPEVRSRDRVGALHALGRLSFTHRYLVRTFGGFHPAEADAIIAPTADTYDESIFSQWLAPADAPALPMPRRAQRLDVLGFCAGSIQPKLDRSCMGVGLELRAPYMDRRMLEWGLTRPVDAREREPRASKAPVRALLARAVECARLPASLLTRPKQGFSLRLDDRAFESLSDVIAHSRLVRHGVLRPDWNAYLTDDTESRRVRLFTLAMMAAWYELRA